MIKLQDLINLEKANPRRVKEYCYYDGCPTTWTRKDIDEDNIKKQRIPYFCSECDFRIWYALRTESPVEDGRLKASSYMKPQDTNNQKLKGGAT